MKNFRLRFLTILLGWIFFCSYTSKARTIITNDSFDLLAGAYYEKAYFTIKSMLLGDIPLSFKDVVIQTENAYLERQLTKDVLDDVIQLYGSVCKGVMISGDIILYITKRIRI